MNVFSNRFSFLASLLTVLFVSHVHAQPPAGQPSSAPNPQGQAGGSQTLEQQENASNQVVGDALKNPNAVLAEFLLNAPDEIKEEGKAAKESFEKKRMELADAVFEMRKRHTRYVNKIANSDDDANAYREQRNKVRELIGETYMASMEVMQFMNDPLAAQFVLTVIQYRSQRDIYDENTLIGAVQLMNRRYPKAFVYLAAARSAVVTGDFEFAERVYKSIDEEAFEETDHAFIAQLDRFKEQWEAESKLRERDAAEDKLPLVKLKTTRGEILVELYPEEAPMTVSHFIRLVDEGFYDGLDFFQVIDELLALTGDPAGDGSGRPDQYLVDEHTREVVRASIYGSLVMAKVPIQGTPNFVPNSAGTQFAILLMPFPNVSEQQTVFGRVIEGMEIVGEFRRVDPHKKKEKTDIVSPPDRILKAEVIRRPEELAEVQYVDRPGAGVPIGQ